MRMDSITWHPSVLLWLCRPCDQCSYCTEFCPRYLLGYEVQPHKVGSASPQILVEPLDRPHQDVALVAGLVELVAFVGIHHQLGLHADGLERVPKLV